ncbi:MAG: 3-deoxy-manno-octulosonate cytidylyltransferase [Chitinophagaceae bacterium]|nr:MAG: 3-deoxy-manno-octulosonate cytidylyltransferase [Chitinophagaceae bacterium]
MSAIAIIPARYGSTRFPGKPLIHIGDKTMIRRVYENTRSVKALDDVIVATDDERIKKEVLSFGGKAVMTSLHHQSGTERCAEAVSGLDPKPDIVINVQGDVPFVASDHIQKILNCFQDSNTQIATVIKLITDAGKLISPHIVKVVFNRKMQAIYFSRTPIPYVRDVNSEIWHSTFNFYEHIGLYGYSSEVLAAIAKLPQGTLERAESLEQLRWLENGYTIRLAETTFENISIDTPEDLSQVMVKLTHG